MDDGERLELAGKLEQAVLVYVKAQRWDQAARVAASLGKNLDAGRYWLEAKEPYEAAICFRRVGALRECQSALLHVPPSSPRYRDACVHTVTVAQILGTPTASLMSFLSPFLNSVPTTRAEMAALNQLAQALADEDKLRLAQTLYKSVLAQDAENEDAREGLLALATREKSRASAPPPPPLSAPPGQAPRPSAPLPGLQRPARGPSLGELLVARDKLPQGELDRLVQRQPQLGGAEAKLAQALIDAGLVGAEDVLQCLAEQTGLPWISDQKLLAGASPEAAKTLSLEQAEKWAVVPIRLADRHLHVAMRDPRDVALVDRVRFASGVSHVTGVFATDYGIRRAIGRLYHGHVPGAGAEEAWQTDPAEADRPARPEAAWAEGPPTPPSAPRRAPALDAGVDLPAPSAPRRAPALDAGIDLPPPPAARLLPSATLDLPAQDAAVDGGAYGAPAPGPQFPMVGSTFAGRYQLTHLIGQGGSAAVFRAQDQELGEPVALKIFRPGAQAESEDVIARFKLELSLSRLLTHPNIIRLFDLGSHSGLRYLTMELLEGTDLNSVLAARRGPLPVAQGLGYLEQVCAGLQAAHDRGVIHRDIKPHNLFITKEGVVKVMDFGIAKKLHSPGVTVAGMVRGTPEFISPEQVNNFSAVTHLTDLYALGATAYAVFTGAPPFLHEELTALLYAHANTPPPPPRAKNPALPEALEGVILRLLEKNPARRLQSAKEVGQLFKAIRTALEPG